MEVKIYVEQNKSLDRQIYKACKNVILKSMIIHCTAHQQVFWGNVWIDHVF